MLKYRSKTGIAILLAPAVITIGTLSEPVFALSVTDQLEVVRIPAVGAAWQTVTLDNSFTSPVVACTYNLPSSSDNEAVVRVRNAGSGSFDVRIQRPLNSPAVTPSDVHCLVAEAGQHSLPDGRIFEAHTVLSTDTSGWAGNVWNGTGADVSAQVTGTYTNPAVLGQVMTYNDANFSAFWSYNCTNRTQPPFSGGRICVGKHIGQTTGTRADETLGYIVVEGGSGSFGGISYSAALGSDSVAGVGNSPPYSYALPQTYSFGVATQEAEDGGQGGWAVLHGANPLAGNQIDLAIDEETVAGDSSRSHTTEQVAYWVFDSSLDFGDAPDSYDDARHVVPGTPTIYLGALAPDLETTSQNGSHGGGDGTGDDTTDTDDEDGVTFRSPAGTNHSIFADVDVVTGGASVTVCGWLDIPSGGTVGLFEPGEGSCQTTSVDDTLTFQWSGLPQDQPYTTYARFRVTSDAITTADATGASSDGEVEDYRVQFDFQPTLATIGEVSLEETGVADLLAELGAGGADLTALLALWDPDLAASLEGSDAATLEQALGAYLDPDGDGAVALLRWNTVEERGTVGFYAERRGAGERGWQRLNGGLLRGLVDSPHGGEYWLADPGALAGKTYRYRLIEQEAWGSQRRHGPWRLRLGQKRAPKARRQPGAAASARQARTQRISAAAQRNRDRGEKHRWGDWQALGTGFGARKRLPEATRAATRAQRRAARGRNAAASTGSAVRRSAPASPAATTALAATADPLTEALWLHTAAEGLYRISVAELAARMTWSEAQLRRWLQLGRRLALTDSGTPVSWHYDAPSDSLLFVAESYRSIHSDENAYRLLRRGASSRVMAVQSGAGPAPGTPTGSFRERLHFEQESVYSLWSVHDDPQADYWFWDYLYGGFKDSLDIALALPDALPSGQGELRIALRGWTDLAAGNDHRVHAELNGQAVGSAIDWDGFDQALLVVSFDQSLLDASGQNTLTLVTEYAPDENPGQWLDRVEVDYWRAPLATDGQLWLHALAAGTHTVGALTGTEVYLIEAPLSDAPILREDFSLAQAGDGSWQITFEAPVEGDYLVVETAALQGPRLSADLPSELSSATNQADYLIIAPRALSETAEALRDYRSLQFPEVQIAWLDDIYQEFSAGRVDPAAIRAFLARVQQAWSGVPEFLTLLGKGTLDHKDRQGYGDSLLPLPMALTPWGLASADNPSVDTDGNGLMDFAYARLPVSAERAGLDYLAKLEAYEAALPGDAAFSAVLGADNPDAGGDFDLNVELFGEELQGYGYQIDIHLHDGLQAALTNPDTWEAAFIGYDGHGSPTQLGNATEDFLIPADVPALSNAALPVFSALTCAVGDDSGPGTASLAATLVLSPAGGAIAALAPTGLSLDADAQVIGSAFAAELLGNRQSIGEAARQAQAQSLGLVSPFMLDIYQVIGEPLVRVP